MEQVGIILLKVNIAILLFGTLYWIVLRRLTFYYLNRIYLLFSVLFALLYPFIEINNLPKEQFATIQEMVPLIVAKTETVLEGRWVTIGAGLWIIGTAVFLLRLILQLYSLHRMHQQSRPSETEKNIRIIEEDINPFSFGPYIYINPNIHTKEQLQSILLHEQIHVRHKHSLDILLTELLLIINWFNPFAWLIRKSVKDNIEFITDAHVLRNGVVKKEYQYHLLHTTCNDATLYLQNNFTIADLKKRIIQMNRRRSASIKLASYFLIPVISGGLLLFNQPVQRIASNVLGIETPALSAKAPTPTNTITSTENSLPNPVPVQNTKTEVTKTVKTTPPPRTQTTEAQKEAVIVVTGYPINKPDNTSPTKNFSGVSIKEPTSPMNNNVKPQNPLTQAIKTVRGIKLTANSSSQNSTEKEPEATQEQNHTNEQNKEIIVTGYSTKRKP